MILEPEMLKRFQPLAVVPGGPATANLMFLGLPTSNHRCPKGGEKQHLIEYFHLFPLFHDSTFNTDVAERKNT